MGRHWRLCTAANESAEMTRWVKSDVFAVLADVRFTPNSDRLLRSSEVTLCAISD